MFNLISVLCLLYNSTDPPSFKLGNLTYQLYPIIKLICPDFNPYRDTIFELYTRKNPTEAQILRLEEDSLLETSDINFNNPTVVFYHGWLESSSSDNAVQIRNNYLNKGDYNVILVNNKRLLAGPFYLTSALNCKHIGQYSAKFLEYLVIKGFQLSNLHIIGMSLGGQIAGLTGQNLKSGKAARITGLDPAGPVFSFLSENKRISKDDGEFVDIIHTNGGIFGLQAQAGHVDFWLNGGTFQPGCNPSETIRRVGTFSELVFCSHYQSYRSYLLTLQNATAYGAKSCSSYKLYQSGICNNNQIGYMGAEVNKTLRGNFFIKTGATALDI